LQVQYHKVYYKRCLDAHIITLIQNDKAAVVLGSQTIEYDQQQIVHPKDQFMYVYAHLQEILLQ
jgi:hypothetical protein